ncbi:hypothetical protein JCM10450v2_007592 [Rhodotorula kratochvilovae]
MPLDIPPAIRAFGIDDTYILRQYQRLYDERAALPPGDHRSEVYTSQMGHWLDQLAGLVRGMAREATDDVLRQIVERMLNGTPAPNPGVRQPYRTMMRVFEDELDHRGAMHSLGVFAPSARRARAAAVLRAGRRW